MAKPKWKINNIAPQMKYTDSSGNEKGKIYAGLMDVNNKYDELLWFTEEKDLEYICKALDFYETYKPLFDELKTDLKYVLKIMENMENED